MQHSSDFTSAFDEPLGAVLDFGTWRQGNDLALFYDRMRAEVTAAVEQAERQRDPVRRHVMARLRERKADGVLIPHCAGLYRLTPDEVEETHLGLVCNGATECCDGTVTTHDSLLLTVVQIGVSLVAYQGNCDTWVQRLYRRDLRASYGDPLEETLALLEKRGRRDAGSENSRDTLNLLVRRILMDYSERAALMRASSAPWRMGHGNPIPMSTLVPTLPELVTASLQVFREMLAHRRFVFVASEPSDRLLLTLGDYLEPLEFLILETLAAGQLSSDNLDRLSQSGSGHATQMKQILEFAREAGPQIVKGVYRAGLHAPARIFYAHADYACEAAAIAIADSTLQPYRGFPMLIDLADLVCRHTFDGNSFRGSLHDAYAAAGAPTRYLGERETRS